MFSWWRTCDAGPKSLSNVLEKGQRLFQMHFCVCWCHMQMSIFFSFGSHMSTNTRNDINAGQWNVYHIQYSSSEVQVKWLSSFKKKKRLSNMKTSVTWQLQIHNYVFGRQIFSFPGLKANFQFIKQNLFSGAFYFYFHVL